MSHAVTPGLLSRPYAVIVATIGFILAASVALWGYYGTAVFYEMILTGLAACL
jgi:hypothetical protein